MKRESPERVMRLLPQMANVIGRVTSGTMSPMMKTGIGMGYVKSAFAKEGTQINILIRNKRALAQGLLSFPFIKNSQIFLPVTWLIIFV
jgi:aminomethyltransferase